MGESDVARFTRDPKNLRLFQQERLLFDVTEQMCKSMKKKGISRSQLAKLLGKSKGRISQILDGERNLTLRIVANVFTALGQSTVISAEDIVIERKRLRFVDKCFENTVGKPADYKFSVQQEDADRTSMLAG